MNEEQDSTSPTGKGPAKRRMLLAGVFVVGVCGLVYFLWPSYPLDRPNRTPGRPWSAWDAADHDVDGLLTREEMERFGNQKTHRDVQRLLQNFDEADTDHNGVVTQQEIDKYGTNVGSMDPHNRP